MMLGPREDILPKDDVFMGIAILKSRRSKDPSTQVGACLVDKDGRIIGTGYNGFPRGIPSDALPWDKEGNPEDTKYLYVGHAEENAIYFSDRLRLKGATLYSTLFPCNGCAIPIIQNQIAEVVYLSDKYHDTSSYIASRRMLGFAGIKVRQFQPSREEIVIRF